MNKILTIKEIRKRYDSEWILVENPKLNKRLEVLAGRVAWHSKDRDEVYQKAIELKLKHSAFLYTGTMPANTAIIL